MQLKAFISHSTADENIAKKIKAALNDYGTSAFLAHEDIQFSQEWKDCLIHELNEANIFIPLLSTSSKESVWVQQEIGMAFAQKDMLFLPLSVDGTAPFGFISHIQGKRIPPDGIYRDLLVEPIIKRFPHEFIPNLINQLASAHTFRNAEALILPLVSHFEKFNDVEIDRFAAAAIENDQIWNANGCREQYLPVFLKLHRSRMDTEKLNALEYQLKHRKRYDLRPNK